MKKEIAMENQNKYKTPYEFILRINNNIISQRYFNIRRYNEKCRESIEIIEMMDEIMGMDGYIQLGIIPEFFKRKCITKSWDIYNPLQYQNRDKVWEKPEFEYKSDFNFEVLVNKEVVVSTSFNANLFHNSVRYNIDIREIIPDIVRTITHYMSLNNYTEKFGDVLLTRHNKYEQ